mgnify:FL=1
MISNQTLSKIRPIVGPPGTGKTHIKIKKLYKEYLHKYGPERGIVLTHTNVAARELKETITSIEEVKELKKEEEFFEDRICTIHSYTNNNSEMPRNLKVFDKNAYDELCKYYSLFGKTNNVHVRNDPVKKHPFFKFRSNAYGRGLDFKKCWMKSENPSRAYDPYDLKMLLAMQENYNKFKEKKYKDFEDMLEYFNNSKQDLLIDFLIIDEAQDCNVPQMLAIERMAKNAKVVVMVGDPNQTIFQFAGANPDFFEKLFAKVKDEDELKEGFRCSKAINSFAKKIIKPIWDFYGYERVWSPTKEEGSVQFLPDLNGSPALKNLINKMRNSNESFLFTYRSAKSREDWILPFLRREGFKFKHVANKNNHVSDEELNVYYTWPEFLKGVPKSLKEIKQYHERLNKKYKCNKNWPREGTLINKDYTFQDFVRKGYLSGELKKENSFYKLHKKYKEGAEQDDNQTVKIKYINRIIQKDNLNQKSIIEYGNFHDVKGLTRDNVIVDLSLTRDEDKFDQRRLGFVGLTRGRYDAWILKTKTGKELII